ncbi:MAG: hypothetical protein K2N38_02480 [Oscillospiraceae bacterium]|nr:hypothetical protein [Oscillospiraceae bacterium]
MRRGGRTTLVVMIAGLVLCTLTRVYTIAAGTDMTMGFFYHDSELLCNILYYGLLTAVAVAAMAAAHKDAKGAFGRVEATDIVDARAAVIGFGLLVLAMYAGYEGMKETKTLSPSSKLIIADFIFAAAGAVLAFVILYKKEFKPVMGFIMAFGGLYYTMRGINCFNKRMVITSIPEYLIQAMSAVGAAVTFILLAKFLSGNAGKLTKTALCGWGAATVVLNLSSAGATALADVTALGEVSARIVPSANEAAMYFQMSAGDEPYKMAFTPLLDVLTGLFIGAVLIVILFARHTERAAKETINEGA